MLLGAGTFLTSSETSTFPRKDSHSQSWLGVVILDSRTSQKLYIHDP